MFIRSHRKVCVCGGPNSCSFKSGICCCLMFHSASNTSIHSNTHSNTHRSTHLSFWASQSSIAASTLAHIRWYVHIHVCMKGRGREAWDPERERRAVGGTIWISIACTEFTEFTCVNPVCLQWGKVAWSLSCPAAWCNTTRSSGHVLRRVSEWKVEPYCSNWDF